MLVIKANKDGTTEFVEEEIDAPEEVTDETPAEYSIDERVSALEAAMLDMIIGGDSIG